MSKILQLIAAQEGWEAVHLNEDGSYQSTHIACWAIIEEDFGGNKVQEVVGMIPSLGNRAIVPAADETAFLGYTWSGCPVDWAEEAREEYRLRHGDR